MFFQTLKPMTTYTQQNSQSPWLEFKNSTPHISFATARCSRQQRCMIRKITKITKDSKTEQSDPATSATLYVAGGSRSLVSKSITAKLAYRVPLYGVTTVLLHYIVIAKTFTPMSPNVTDSFHFDNPQNECQVCGKIYSNRKSLIRHERYECNLPPRFACSLCPHRSRRQHDMHLHVLNKHTQINIDFCTLNKWNCCAL